MLSWQNRSQSRSTLCNRQEMSNSTSWCLVALGSEPRLCFFDPWLVFSEKQRGPPSQTERARRFDSKASMIFLHFAAEKALQRSVLCFSCVRKNTATSLRNTRNFCRCTLSSVFSASDNIAGAFFKLNDTPLY